MRNSEFLDFPITEYERRLFRLRSFMQEQKIDLIFITSRDNVEYISGFTTTSWRLVDKRFWMLIPLEDDPILMVDTVHEVNAEKTSWVENIEIWGRENLTAVDIVIDYLKNNQGKIRKVALELDHGPIAHICLNEYDELKAPLNHFELVDANSILARTRIKKSPEEIDRIIKACEITCKGFEKGFDSIRIGMEERKVLAIIVREFLASGADTAYNSTNHGYLSFQSNRKFQMTPSPTMRKIEKGDLIQIDGGAVFRSYTADIYRNAYVGEAPPDVLVEYNKGGQEILHATLDAIKPGITSAQIATAAEKKIHEIGFDKKRRVLMDAVSAKKGSMIGHGLGISIHEMPFISKGDKSIWEEGMVGSIEFGFGDPINGYIHCEENILVTGNGHKVLTPLDSSIRVVGI